MVPGGVAGLAAEDQAQRGVEELEGLGPLRGSLGVVRCCHLADLPRSPHLDVLSFSCVLRRFLDIPRFLEPST